MRVYRYLIIDSAGFKVRGKVESDTREDAIAQLPPHNGLKYIKDVGEVFGLPPKIKDRLGIGKIANKDLGGYLNQLASLMASGISVVKSLQILSNGKKATSALSKRLIDGIVDGKSFSESFRSCSKMFNTDITGLIATGQAAGNLETTLFRISEQLTQSVVIKSKIRAALAYPAMVLVLTIAVAIFLFTTIIPQMQQILKEMSNSELPALTKAVMAMSDVLVNYGFIIAMVMIGAYLFLRKVIKKFFLINVHRIMVKMPVIGKVIRYGQMILFYQNLGFMLESGFTTSEALRLSINSVTNLYIKKCLGGAYTKVMEGSSLTKALESATIVKQIEIQTVEVGSNTGQIEKQIGLLVARMNRETEEAIAIMLKAIEPVIIIVLGAIVGLILFSVYGPMLSMASVG